MTHRFLMLVAGLTLGLCACTTETVPGSSGLRSGSWIPAAANTVQAASVTNGPWTLTQNAATLAHPLAGYCDTFGPAGHVQVNTTKTLMQPYYFPLITGSGQTLDGYFDYRVKDQDEALVHATSKDGGLTWTTDATKLRLNAGMCPANDATPLGNDNGQGHAMILTVNGKQLLYTLDRVSGVADSGGLLIHDVTAGVGTLPDSEPVSVTTPVPVGVKQTAGLLNPDGILGAVPGTGTDASNPLKVLYLNKPKGSKAAPAQGLDPSKLCTDTQSKPFTTKGANYDRTELRMASTADGVTFTDLGALSGLNNPNDNASVGGFRYIGPRGSLLRYTDGSYGLFFSGGNCQDGDSDAYHFIGYAHSTDALNWTIDNGAANPLVQVDYSYPASMPAAYSTGRVYSPTVLANGDGTLRLIFSGYRTGKPLPDTGVATGAPAVTFQGTDAANYRSILILNLHR
ncbi:hypothetical protein [Deinococcus ruber]|uniref:Exo-alpha-sialidase n=1 Tax=Deinococcus ruber TaxID=1848197 RepID=A0A918KV68_9DEIO|nr:hypothetical protein [Deinococcus ruber]GGR35268.1 hypothetical protein GCM10008957_51570 [Deinococcus ruber]